MQKILIRAVGKLKSPFEEVFEEFRKRLTSSLAVEEILPKKGISPESQRKQANAVLLRPPSTHGTFVAWDACGETLSSQGFAEWLHNTSGSSLVFLVGGADGIDPSVLRCVGKVLSFGPMIWSHQLARVMLIEQIYRAQQILSHHPYHKGHDLK
ncbi:MAG: 23S rRNA (pseudouridine(1915)-N(3))-methyltransferase RlmH [Holosporales bacterium]|jgi:23S rRNA (pseudouridine1915-N3)-methyltransferase|nr:23S rRNA (pseudouridine(1915)-N(3))-methyltransferase RlmH [Holosporales bacterium]